MYAGYLKVQSCLVAFATMRLQSRYLCTLSMDLYLRSVHGNLCTLGSDTFLHVPITQARPWDTGLFIRCHIGVDGERPRGVPYPKRFDWTTLHKCWPMEEDHVQPLEIEMRSCMQCNDT